MLSLGAVLSLRSGVLLESTPEQCYLYDPDTQSYALLDNDIAIEIIRLCDGALSIRSICQRIALLYDEPIERVQEDVLGMLTALAQESFLQPAIDDAQES
jgi:hypothetical protein